MTLKYPQDTELRVEPYDLDKYFEYYLEFVREAFVASKRSILDFENFSGTQGEKYYKRLKKWQSEGAHLAQLNLNNDLVGICEASIDKNRRGIISLIYIRPIYRGRNYAVILEESAISYFRTHKVNTAVLNVTTANLRAIQFYKKNGWIESSEKTYLDDYKLYKKYVIDKMAAVN